MSALRRRDCSGGSSWVTGGPACKIPVSGYLRDCRSVSLCSASQSLLSSGEISQSHADEAPIGEGGHNLEAPAEVLHSNAGMGQPSADELQRQIELARAQLEAARSEALAAQALADKERNSAERERTVNETLQRGLHNLRQDLAKLKAAVADEGDLRRELMAARQELLALQEANPGAAESRAPTANAKIRSVGA